MMAALISVWDQAKAAGALLATPQAQVYQTVESEELVAPPEPEPA
jgi:hypothetical protein